MPRDVGGICRIFSEGILELQAALEGSMKNALKDVVDLIEKHRGAILTGVGKSFDICQTAESSWHSFEIPAWAMDPIKALHGDLGRLRKGETLVIALSNSGNTDEMRPVIEKIKGNRSGPWVRFVPILVETAQAPIVMF